MKTSTTPSSRTRTIFTSRKKTEGILLVACVLSLGLLLRAGHAGVGLTPEQTVQHTADRAREIVADEKLSRDEKIERLSRLMDGASDFETTAKLVLARGWHQLNDEQKKEFQRLLRDYLIARYRDRVDQYAGERLVVTGGRPEARGDYTVHAKVERGDGLEPYLVDYRLRRGKNGEWRVIDVVAEGISIVSNLRSQFQSLLSRGGPEKLLEALRKKVAEGAHAPADSSAGARSS